MFSRILFTAHYFDILKQDLEKSIWERARDNAGYSNSNRPRRKNTCDSMIHEGIRLLHVINCFRSILAKHQS